LLGSAKRRHRVRLSRVVLSNATWSSLIMVAAKNVMTAVCISKERQSFSLPIPFVSYTANYRPITHRDNNDMARITYMTDRYNAAVKVAIETNPNTEHVLLIDHYYLPFFRQLQILIDDYCRLENVILGASIWYWARRRIRPWIAYYDTLSVPEFQGKKWWNTGSLPTGIIPVTGVGGCWIFPRQVWAKTGGFGIPTPPQAGGSRGMNTAGYRTLLDCNCLLWRTHETNPDIPDYSMMRRVFFTARHAQRRVFRMLRHRR
jgi:hypothetical protein